MTRYRRAVDRVAAEHGSEGTMLHRLAFLGDDPTFVKLLDHRCHAAVGAAGPGRQHPLLPLPPGRTPRRRDAPGCVAVASGRRRGEPGPGDFTQAAAVGQGGVLPVRRVDPGPRKPGGTPRLATDRPDGAARRRIERPAGRPADPGGRGRRRDVRSPPLAHAQPQHERPSPGGCCSWPTPTDGSGRATTCRYPRTSWRRQRPSSGSSWGSPTPPSTTGHWASRPRSPFGLTRLLRRDRRGSGCRSAGAT